MSERNERAPECDIRALDSKIAVLMQKMQRPELGKFVRLEDFYLVIGKEFECYRLLLRKDVELKPKLVQAIEQRGILSTLYSIAIVSGAKSSRGTIYVNASTALENRAYFEDAAIRTGCIASLTDLPHYSRKDFQDREKIPSHPGFVKYLKRRFPELNSP